MWQSACLASRERQGEHTAVVYNLKVESEREPLGVTGTHPFWSVDRQAWVSAADLKNGETLKTLEGTTVVESLELRPEAERVCNIEVDGDYVYRIGTSGVLVHNQCTPPGDQAVVLEVEVQPQTKKSPCCKVRLTEGNDQFG